MRLEVGLAQVAAVGLHEGVDLVRDLAFVEHVPALLADQAQGVGETRVLEHVALRRGLAGGGQGVRFLPRAGQVFEGREVAAPVEGDGLRDGVALLRVPDGPREVIGEGELAELVVQRSPAVHAPRDVDGQHADGRQEGAVQLGDGVARLFVGKPLRRAARAVEAVEFVLLGDVDDGEQVAADAVGDGFHQAERRVGGDGGVDRVAAALEHVEPDLTGRGHARADHPVRPERLRARGEGLAHDAVDLRERGGGQQTASGEQEETRGFHHKSAKKETPRIIACRHRVAGARTARICPPFSSRHPIR